MSDVFNEIREERQRQDEQWGGPEHDDTHDPLAWVGFIADQQEKVAVGAITRGESYYTTPDCRQRIVKIAALAVAALESMDRKESRR
jgi:hypothetical protein